MTQPHGGPASDFAVTGLPKPRRNVGAHGHELDFFWPELRLNVEMDGYRWHSTRARLNRDRRRDAELKALWAKYVRVAYPAKASIVYFHGQPKPDNCRSRWVGETWEPAR